MAFPKDWEICNYQNFKDAYSFLSGGKILCFLYFDSYPSLGHLILRTLPINVIGFTKNFACLICEQGFKNEKEARILVCGANQKGYATSYELLYTDFCERNQFLFSLKSLSKFFCTDASRHVPFIR